MSNIIKSPCSLLAPGFSLLLSFALISGCSSNQNGNPESKGPEVNFQNQSTGKIPIHNVQYNPKWHQPFNDAVFLEPPDNEQRPPDTTHSGTSIGKVFKAIAGENGQGGLWEEIKFQSPSGKALTYTARIETELGDITMAFYPQFAPNHVRNFLCLANAGYFDGLGFDRTVKEAIANEPGKFLEYIEGGCPKGTGEPGFGSVGYWMKPEISDKIQHAEGSVGASHGEDLESASSKFYITLNKAPCIDGQFTIFARVTSGLDVARLIYNRPRTDENSDRPRSPVTIRRIQIQVTEADGPLEN